MITTAFSLSLENGGQGGTEQGFPKPARPGQKERLSRSGQQFVNSGSFIHVKKALFADFSKILYPDG
jgi:hypothetical protein